MSDSSAPSAKQPSFEERLAIGKIKTGLMDDLAAGDFDRARARLRLNNPARARAAVMQLGAPYLQAVKNCPNARLDSRRGAEAIKGFINEELRPLVAREAKRPVYVKPQKNTLLRKLARGAAGVALVLGLSAPMVLHHTFPAHSDEPVMMEVVQADISPLRQEFARTSLGRDMLAMAAAHNISIEYDSALSSSTAAGTYNAGDKKVRMDPTQPMPAQVMYLAHELRHAWQDIVLGYGEMENRMLTPQQQWTLRRYLEADAFAFSSYFMAERMAELPDAALPGGSREMPAARRLLAEFSSEDGLTHDEYRRFALERMFTFLDSYDDKHLELAIRANRPIESDIKFAQDMRRRGELESAQQTLDILQGHMAGTPSADDFAVYLRRLGGMSLEPDAQTALQSPSPSPQSAAAALSAETTVITAAPPPAPDSASRKADVAAQLAAAENLHQTFRALAQNLTELTRLEIEAARAQGRPTNASRFYPIVNDPPNGHGRNTPAHVHMHGHNCEVHAEAPKSTAPQTPPRPR